MFRVRGRMLEYRFLSILDSMKNLIVDFGVWRRVLCVLWSGSYRFSRILVYSSTFRCLSSSSIKIAM